MKPEAIVVATVAARTLLPRLLVPSERAGGKPARPRVQGVGTRTRRGWPILLAAAQIKGCRGKGKGKGRAEPAVAGVAGVRRLPVCWTSERCR